MNKAILQLLTLATVLAFVGSCYLVLAWLNNAPWASIGFGVTTSILGSILLRRKS